jgi:hypothetical protein
MAATSEIPKTNLQLPSHYDLYHDVITKAYYIISEMDLDIGLDLI